MKRLKELPIARRARLRMGAFHRDETGAAAVEFALVAMPFLMMTFFIINIGMYYYTVNSIDKGIKDATRQILTGNAQSTAMTVGNFQSLMCTQANMGSNYIDCSKLHVLIASTNNGWGPLVQQAGKLSCVSGGALAPSTGNAGDALSAYTNGTAAFVIVMACYQWDGSTYLPFFNLGTFADGTTLIQSAIAFQTEPYS